MTDTPPGLRERKKQELRRHIAQTALAMFLERGFDEVPVAEVAEAAGVSKMTVFNHFPEKKDLVLSLSVRGLPDLAAAVRGRRPGQSAIDAVRLAVRKDFRDRGKENEPHRDVAQFLRMAFRSPTLLQAFGQQWNDVRGELAVALAEAIGEPPPPLDIDHQFFSAVRGDGDPAEIRSWLRSVTVRSTLPHLVSGQITSTLQQVTMANLVRVGAGIPLQESTKTALRDVDTAFGLLANGLGDFAVREPR